MKARFVPLALIVTLLLTVGAFTAACGDDGGDALTLEEYFQQLSEAKHELGAGSRDATPQNAGTTLSEEQQLQALADSFTEGIPFVEHFLAEIEMLRPPEAVTVEHNQIVEETSLFLAVMNRVSEKIGAVETVDELEPLFERERYSQAAFRFRDACTQLQLVADKNEIDVNLVCG